MYRLPRPDLVIWLDVPVPTALELIAQKPPRQYTAKPADLHEADGEYLSRVAEVYRHLDSQDKIWKRVAVCDRERLQTPEVVHQHILEHFQSAAGV